MSKKKDITDEAIAQIKKLPSNEQALLILAMAFSKVPFETVQTATGLFIGWHEKQHASYETCEHCEIARHLVSMYAIIEMLHEQWEKWGKQS